MHLSDLTITQIGALIVAAVATITDIRIRRISNLVTFPGMLIGIAMRGMLFAQGSHTAYASFASGALDGFLGCLLGIFSQAVFHGVSKDWVAFGDVKLMGAVGAFLGPAGILVVFLYHAFVYGTYSFVMLGKAFPWRQLAIAYNARTLRTLDLNHFNKVRKMTLPVAPIITGGLVLAIWLQHPTLRFLGLEQ